MPFMVFRNVKKYYFRALWMAFQFELFNINDQIGLH